MTALEIAQKNYNQFEDKKDITALINALFCVESDYKKRDDEGNESIDFEIGVFDAIAQTMITDFVSSKRRSQEIRGFCVEIIKKMKY